MHLLEYFALAFWEIGLCQNRNKHFLESRLLPEVFSLEKELLEKESGSSELKCLIFDDPFIDIGIPEDYHRAATLLGEI